MPESQQRLICRTLFIIGCIVPAAIVSYLVVCNGKTQTWEACIQNSVGLQATIGNVRTPVPNVVELEDLVLRDFTRGSMLGIDRVTIARTSKGQRVIVSDLQIKSGDLPLLIQRFGAMMNRSEAKLPTTVQFKQICLTPDKEAPLVHLLNGQLRSVNRNGNPSLAFDFNLSPDAQKPCELTMSLSQVGGELFTKLVIKTNQAEIPCWIMSAWDDSFALLGNNATFSGEAIGSISRSGHFTRLHGKIEHVDLTQLVTNNLPHSLDGVATIVLKDCLIDQDGIQAMQGRLSSRATAGRRQTVGPSLLAEAREHLGMNAALSSSMQTPVEYEKIQLDFLLNNRSKSIQLWGTCDVQGQGIAMVNAQGVPILQTVQKELPMANLIRTFLPDGSQQAITHKGCRQILALFPSKAELRSAFPSWYSQFFVVINMISGRHKQHAIA